MNLEIEYLDHYNYEEWGPLKYANKGDACFDLRYAGDNIIILYGLKKSLISYKNRALIPTGIKVNIPNYYEIRISMRSGLALNHGLTLINGIGVVDHGYKGEIGLIVLNSDIHSNYIINPGDRIAQAKLSPIPYVNIVKVDNINMNNDRNGGLGSTGKY